MKDRVKQKMGTQKRCMQVKGGRGVRVVIEDNVMRDEVRGGTRCKVRWVERRPKG